MARIYKIRIFKKTPTEKHPHTLTVYLAGDTDDTGTFHRSFERKGVHVHNMLAQRDMTQKERETYEAAWRLHTMNYTDWKGLIEDEYIESNYDTNWCRELLSLSGLKEPLENIIDLPDPW